MLILITIDHKPKIRRNRSRIHLGLMSRVTKKENKKDRYILTAP